MVELAQPNCHDCSLNNKYKVEGSGPLQPKLMVVGQAPGSSENLYGKPFVGQSGTLLRDTLNKIAHDGYDQDVYYTNACLCYNYHRKNPTRKDATACLPRLISEIAKVKPEKLLLLGNDACLSVVGRKLNEIKGRVLDYNGIPTLATYHPAFVLRTASTYSDFYRDIEKLLVSKSTKLTETPKWQVLRTEGQVYEAFENLPPIMALDYETASASGKMADNTNWRICWPTAFGFCGNTDIVYIVKDDLCNIDLSRFTDKEFIGSNFAHFDWFLLRKFNKLHAKVVHDTSLMHYLIDEGTKFHGLKSLANYYLDAPDWDKPLKDVKYDYSKLAPGQLEDYLAWDVMASYMLYEILNDELSEIYPN